MFPQYQGNSTECKSNTHMLKFPTPTGVHKVALTTSLDPSYIGRPLHSTSVGSHFGSTEISPGECHALKS